LSLFVCGALAMPLVAQDRQDSTQDRQQQQKSQQQSQQSQRPGQGDQAPEGFIIVEERLVYVLADQPQLHMTQAVAKLAQDDNRAAAEELRLAADYVALQGSRGKGEASSQIKQSADKLRTIADKIEGGELKDSQKLSNAFAKVNLNLARHHNALAKSFLENDRYVAAGHDLASAATSLKQALVWTNEQPQQELITMLGNADRIAAELRAESVGEQLSGDDRAQPAGARQTPDQQRQDRQDQSPVTGTSDAEAKNIAQHAQKITDELSQQIDQFASKIGTKDSSQQSQQQSK
jgi:hypothetical protein